MKGFNLKKLKIKRVIICLLLLIAIIYGIIQLTNSLISKRFADGSGDGATTNTTNEVDIDIAEFPEGISNETQSKYPIVKEDTNSDYDGKRTGKIR